MGNSANIKSIYEDQTLWKIVTVRLNYKVIKNMLTNEQLQQHIISLDDQVANLNHQIRLYEERKMFHDYIVRCVHYFKQKNETFCKGVQNYQVITERINRFNCITNLDEKKAFGILKQSLIAYEHVLSRYGNFNINSSMIGINKQGKIKIWINQNFGDNNIIREPNSSFSEEQNILRIHKIISDKVQYQEFKHVFNFCNSKLTLKLALEYLNNYTIEMNKKINKSIQAYKSRLGPRCQLKFNYMNSNNSFSYLKKASSINKFSLEDNHINSRPFSKINNYYDNSQTSKESTTFSMNPTNTNTYTNSNISNYKIESSEKTKKMNLKRYGNQSDKNKHYNSTSKIYSYDVNIESTKQEFSKLSLRNKRQTSIKDAEIENEKKIKLQSIAKIDSIIVIQKQEDYLGNNEYVNSLSDNVLLVESTILRS